MAWKLYHWKTKNFEKQDRWNKFSGLFARYRYEGSTNAGLIWRGDRNKSCGHIKVDVSPAARVQLYRMWEAWAYAFSSSTKINHVNSIYFVVLMSPNIFDFFSLWLDSILPYLVITKYGNGGAIPMQATTPHSRCEWCLILVLGTQSDYSFDSAL